MFSKLRMPQHDPTKGGIKLVTSPQELTMARLFTNILSQLSTGIWKIKMTSGCMMMRSSVTIFTRFSLEYIPWMWSTMYKVNGPMWCIVSYFSLDLNFVKLTSPSKSLQCLSDWTHKIGAAGLTAVNNYLMEEYNMDEDCQEFADLILEDLWFLWHDNDPAVHILTISCIFEDN